MMKRIYLMLLTGLLLTGCQEKKREHEKLASPIEFNQDLAAELERMAEIDQVAASLPEGKYKNLTTEQWNAFQDSVFVTHQHRAAEIVEKYGYPGYDLLGEEGSANFWLLVQHSDHTPEFQKKVLNKMDIEVKKGNADPIKYGLLVDRVNLNTGKPQVYGTQVTYNTKICQAYPKELADSATVNERRKSIGLPPIEEYLNQMTKTHFEMNKERYFSQGITEPKLYKVN